MAVRMPQFRTAAKDPKDPRSSQDRSDPRDKPKAGPRTGADARAAVKPAPKSQSKTPLKPQLKPKTQAAGKPRSAAKPSLKARREAASRTAPTRPRRFGLKRKAAPEPAPVPAAKAAPKTEPEAAAGPAFPTRERPRTPVLQRRTWGATLARFLVLTVAIVCMVGFAVALAKVTLVPSPSSDALIHTNLKPGDSIRAYLDQPNVRDSVKQIGGNILLGVPFGILLPMLFPKARGLLRVAVLTALVMLLVEATQGVIVEGRAFDIDDVILNTAGALIGYLLLGLRLGRALHPRRQHWWQSQRVRQDRQQVGQDRRQTRQDRRQVRRDRQPARKRP